MSSTHTPPVDKAAPHPARPSATSPEKAAQAPQAAGCASQHTVCSAAPVRAFMSLSSPPPAALAGAFFRALNSPDGQIVLAHLTARTVQRSPVPSSDSPNFTHLLCLKEGENQLVRYILQLMERGRVGEKEHPCGM